MNETKESSAVWFINISGTVAANKKKEFEQTIRFVFNQLPGTCIQRTLMSEAGHEDKMYVYSEWQNENALQEFISSEEYRLVMGAYKALGMLGETAQGVKQK